MTLYLKYRPQTIEELDLGEVRQMLSKSLASKNIPHAWLFSGPRGTGKTSAARILAKYLNCTGGKKDKPCNECEMCRAITAGSAVDVAEIDAASNRGIDEIRELKEKIRLAPMNAGYKVYIIDEVHMLTTEAANALLKSLEEPPENTVFVLCTTDPGKLPETVISRCTRVVFGKPRVEEIAGKLKQVAKGEGQKFTDEDLSAIARAGRGSFRDAIKLMEQVIMSGGEVDKVLGQSNTDDSIRLLDLVERSNGREALELVAKMDAQGQNFRRLVESLVEELRTRLLDKAESKAVNQEIKWIEQLSGVYEQIKTSAVPQLPLEIWIIQNTRVTEAATAKAPKSEDKPAPKADEVPVAVEKTAGKEKYRLGDLAGKWPEVLKAVRPMNHSVEALLRSTKPIDFDGERLELEVFYKFHKDKLETEKCRRIVEEAVEQVMDMSRVKLYLKLGQKVNKMTEEVTADGVSDEVVAAAEEIFGAQAI